TTAEIGKENKTKVSEALNIIFPEKNILDLIQNHDIDDSVIEIVHELLIVEYEKQYKDKKEKGNLDQLKAYDKKSFANFLKSIRWFFGEEDNEALKESALVKIKKSQFFN